MSLKDRILARTDLSDMVAARDITGITEALNNEGLNEMAATRYINVRTILSECGIEGPIILDALEAAAEFNSSVKWAINFLNKDSGINIGNPVTLAQIDNLVAATVITEAQGTLLRNMALQPVLVSRAEVEQALYNPDGSAK